MSQDILTKTFTAMRANLLARARRLLNADDEADDALQEAFCRLWSHRESVSSAAHAAGLSATAVRNVCLDELRRRSSHPEADIDEARLRVDEPPDAEATREVYDRVRAIIDSRLGERERQVLDMRDVREMEFDEIAAELGISEANARLILSRARRTVREIYLSTQK